MLRKTKTKIPTALQFPAWANCKPYATAESCFIATCLVERKITGRGVSKALPHFGLWELMCIGGTCKNWTLQRNHFVMKYAIHKFSHFLHVPYGHFLFICLFVYLLIWKAHLQWSRDKGRGGREKESIFHHWFTPQMFTMGQTWHHLKLEGRRCFWVFHVAART